MARSTLFALLVMALFQVALAIPFGLNTIVNKAADGVLKGQPFQLLSVQPGDLRGNPWYLQPSRQGVIISTPDRRLSVTLLRGQATLTPQKTEWSLEKAGEDLFTIRPLYNADLALGWDESTKNVYVERLEGGDEQVWQIKGPSYDYGRMYRQY
ncbi:hypothetical protein EC968_008999 [Mortierella alpina]|nr:hypothetical protein EC968_008999 [Mortierella alpina]